MPAEIQSLGANGRTPEESIERGIRFAFGSENLGLPYEVVVRSGQALREKWPQLVSAKRRKMAGESGEVTTEDLVRIEANLRRKRERSVTDSS